MASTKALSARRLGSIVYRHLLRTRHDLHEREPKPKQKEQHAMLDVYIAKSIVTMNRSLPEATAIAIRDGMVIEVGSLESLQPWLIREDYVIHREFESSVMVPGFIDPHLHPAMA
ncbi:MAG: hypothetical protein EBY55_12155, partial [Gammaproteobacteria bacterium]|nr:hypothetical protein [Gammaproteobacteria bacterium]